MKELEIKRVNKEKKYEIWTVERENKGIRERIKSGKWNTEKGMREYGNKR